MKKNNNIGSLETEARNPRTMTLDQMTAKEAVEAVMKEERNSIEACIKASDKLAQAVELYIKTIQGGGKIIQAGSGCSGDYVHTDVLELSATFSLPTDGYKDKDNIFALHTQKGWYFNPQEHKLVDEWYNMIKKRDGSEDSLTQPVMDMDYINFKEDDLLILVTASGRSPAIVKLAKEAKRRKGKVISLVMNENSEIAKYSDIVVEAIVGPPPLTGSGRTLAGTASKILLTTLSTVANIRMGAAYSNLMVNLNVKKWLDNSKFVDRGTRIVQDITNVDYAEAKKVLKKAKWNIKIACVMIKKSVSYKKAKTLLKQKNNLLRSVIN